MGLSHRLYRIKDSLKNLVPGSPVLKLQDLSKKLWIDLKKAVYREMDEVPHSPSAPLSFHPWFEAPPPFEHSIKYSELLNSAIPPLGGLESLYSRMDGPTRSSSHIFNLDYPDGSEWIVDLVEGRKVCPPPEMDWNYLTITLRTGDAAKQFREELKALYDYRARI